MNSKIETSERVETGDRILDVILNTTQAAIIVPPRLLLEMTALVQVYAAQHREQPLDCIRGVELAVLQLGLRALKEQLKANAELGERMGWAKEEEQENT